MTQPTLIKKLESIAALANECLQELGSVPLRNTKSLASSSTTPKPMDIVLQIVNKISDCDEAVVIQTAVLDKRGVEGRVLLPFYISSKYFNNQWLTSGDIEKITSDLGVKIDKKNISNSLVNYKKYLESGAVRKKGQSTPYRLNRNGAKRFEEIIKTTSGL